MVLFLRKWSKNITVEIKPMLSMTQMVILHWDRCWWHLWWCSTVRLSDQNRNICCAVRSVQGSFEMVKWCFDWVNDLDQINSEVLSIDLFCFGPTLCTCPVPLWWLQVSNRMWVIRIDSREMEIQFHTSPAAR